MQTDRVYLSTCQPNLQLLVQACKGEWNQIPEEYLDHFYHEFNDGDISLLPVISRLTDTEFLDDWHIDEVVESLTKANPEHWPDLQYIESIDAEAILKVSEESEDSCDYVEDNIGTADKVEKVLKSVLESVFGKGITSIRSHKGKYPCAENNFLQESDGTFSGTFSYENHQFNFEIAPTEAGWLCTYRMNEKCLDKLEKPEFKGQRKDNKPDHRKVRSQGWR